MDSTGKSLIVLSALVVAALTWYVGGRFLSAPAAETAPAAASQAAVAQTQAALATAQSKEQSDASKLQALLKGQNAASLAAAELAVRNAEAALNTAFDNEYSDAYDAIYKKTDILFAYASSSNPNILIPAGSAAIQAAINTKRAQISGLLAAWKPADAPIISAYLAQLETIVESLTPESSGLTQAQIDAYQAAVELAITEVDEAIADVATAQANLNLADDELTLQEDAGNPDAIAAEEQAVTDDESDVAALQAELAAQTQTDDTGDQASGTDDTGDQSDVGQGGQGNPPPGYFYTPGDVQAEQQQFQQLIKNGPPELLNF